jgi:Cys-tRNA(Pro)/Cys-tRNA(Cys) deacylase
MSAKATRATDRLDRAGVPYRVHLYEVSERVGDGYGKAVAAAIGLPPDRVFKTLIAEVDGEPMVAILPVDRRLSTKSMARAVGGKRCSLASPATAERLTGYVTGGISPFGQRQQMRAVLDLSASGLESIAVSGGRRGVQLELSPEAVLEMTGGALAPIAEP